MNEPYTFREFLFDNEIKTRTVFEAIDCWWKEYEDYCEAERLEQEDYISYYKSMGISTKMKGKLPTREEFKKYMILDLQGIICMNDIGSVMRHTGLSSEKIIYIREHLRELNKKYYLKLKQ